MKPEEQIIAIAETCGWHKEQYTHRAGCWISPGGRTSCRSILALPDYITDLDAMHEAEKVLKARATFAPGCPWKTYETFLARIVPGDCGMFHITAAQRAEAFVRTLNLWKD